MGRVSKVVLPIGGETMTEVAANRLKARGGEDTRSVSLTKPTGANSNFPEDHFRVVLLWKLTGVGNDDEDIEWVVAHPGPYSRAREFADLLIHMSVLDLAQAKFDNLNLTQIQDGAITVVQYVENEEEE